MGWQEQLTRFSNAVGSFCRWKDMRMATATIDI